MIKKLISKLFPKHNYLWDACLEHFNGNESEAAEFYHSIREEHLRHRPFEPFGG